MFERKDFSFQEKDTKNLKHPVRIDYSMRDITVCWQQQKQLPFAWWMPALVLPLSPPPPPFFLAIVVVKEMHGKWSFWWMEIWKCSLIGGIRFPASLGNEFFVNSLPLLPLRNVTKFECSWRVSVLTTCTRCYSITDTHRHTCTHTHPYPEKGKRRVSNFSQECYYCFLFRNR